MKKLKMVSMGICSYLNHGSTIECNFYLLLCVLQLSATEEQRQNSGSNGESPAKKRRRDDPSSRAPPIDIELPDVTYDEPHPLVQPKRSVGVVSAGAYQGPKGRQGGAGVAGSSGSSGVGGRKTSRNSRDRSKTKSKP